MCYEAASIKTTTTVTSDTTSDGEHIYGGKLKDNHTSRGPGGAAKNGVAITKAREIVDPFKEEWQGSDSSDRKVIEETLTEILVRHEGLRIVVKNDEDGLWYVWNEKDSGDELRKKVHNWLREKRTTTMARNEARDRKKEIEGNS